MKKFFGLILAALVFAVLMFVFVSADASGEMYHVYTNPSTGGSSVIVNNSWEYVDSEKTLYIRSLTDGYNECGRTSYASDGAWSDYASVIEHVVLVGNFNKITGGSFSGYKALKTFTISTNTQQYDGSCFDGCTNLESITIKGNHHIKGYADLRNIVTMNSNKQFLGTKLDTFNLGDGVDIKAPDPLNHFPEGSNIYVYKSSTNFELLSESGLFNVMDGTPVSYEIHFGDNVYNMTYEFDSQIFRSLDGSGVALFLDSSFKVPYIGENITDGQVLYAKPIISTLGAMVRIEDYQGLRAIFSLDAELAENFGGLEIKEYGCLAKTKGFLDRDIYYGQEGIYNVKVYSEGEFVGKVLEYTPDEVKFAYTAVGFEDDEGKINISNAEKDLIFRGYIIFVDSEGQEHICYTNEMIYDLVTACKKTIAADSESSVLTSEQVDFVRNCIDMGAVSNYIYTKEEALALLAEVYNDEEHYIPAQHLDAGRNSLVNYLEVAEIESGTLPALVSFDFINLIPYEENDERLIQSIKDYIEMGGLVSFSYHMENPTGNYTDQGLCRGELGGEADWEALVTPGTALNERFNEILDEAAIVLKALDREGYPILWRPLHEMNGDWFWWCTIQGWSAETEYVISQETFKALWIYIYEYFTEDWGMENLIWVYSPSPSTSTTVSTASTLPVMYCYPGDEYCDIVGGDWYVGRDTSVSDNIAYNYNIGVAYEQLMETPKPVALTEFGPSSSNLKAGVGEKQEDYFSCRDQLDLILKMKEDGYKLTYVLNWSGWISMQNLGYMDEIMQHESALDIFEIKDMFDVKYRNR